MKALIIILLGMNQVFAATSFLYVKGKVEVNSKKATKKMSLNVGDKITVYDNSLAVVKMDNKAFLKIDKNSEVILEKINPGQKESNIVLNLGSLFSKVLIKSKNKKSLFNVKVSKAIMGVRGTEFFVSTGQGSNKKDIWMCVEEGKVEVNLENKKTLVNEGEGILIEKGQKVTPPKKYAWTKKLNWNMDDSKGELENKVLDVLYQDLLDQDYD